MSSDHLKNMTTEERIAARKKGQDAWNNLYTAFYNETTDQIRGYLRGVPDGCKRLYVSALTMKLSTKQAIKAKCMDCASFQKEEITECSVKTCPLYAYRPYQKRVKK
jgi:hypothetical protein